MKLLEKRHNKVTINITSLIDVLFLLLIFFMVSSTFLEQPGMKLELPETRSHATEKIENLILQMTTDEQLILNGEAVAFDVLEEKIKELLPSVREKTLVLKADKLVKHGTVVDVMDIAKLSGVEKIVIATKVESSNN
ncbi:biopolymer transporter ExbD [candidate division KSB1 bacterium]|nr:biopolymer transporter ExbD [candidate division KSB1 bacterium]